jgi:hypothetical protein
MKRRKLTELYGRRYTPWSNFIGVLLVVAFGSFLAITEGKKETVGEETQTEQSEGADRGFDC